MVPTCAGRVAAVADFEKLVTKEAREGGVSEKSFCKREITLLGLLVGERRLLLRAPSL
jgi:hypothetical protein